MTLPTIFPEILQASRRTDVVGTKAKDLLRAYVEALHARAAEGKLDPQHVRALLLVADDRAQQPPEVRSRAEALLGLDFDGKRERLHRGELLD